MRDGLPNLLIRLGIPVIFQSLTDGFPVVFMLHRFRSNERTPGGDRAIRGHSVEEVRRGIRHLRTRKYDILSLSELFARLRSGAPLRKAVVFTMDDGYADQAARGIPLFEDEGCPLTIFLTTGFLDGKLWLWWDRVEHVFLATERRRLEVRVGSDRVVYCASGMHWMEPDWTDFIERCKRVPEAEKNRAIAELAAVAGVEIPAEPPPPFRPMQWAEVRAAESRGLVTFGAHTVTHPILSQAGDAQVRHELEESWRRLREEVRHAQPVFGYPNGRAGDYGSREIAILRELGFVGALGVQERYLDAHMFRHGREGAYRLSRFSYPPRLQIMIQRITGMDRALEMLRSAG